MSWTVKPISSKLCRNLTGQCIEKGHVDTHIKNNYRCPLQISHNCYKGYFDLLRYVLEAADLSFQCCNVYMGNKIRFLIINDTKIFWGADKL